MYQRSNGVFYLEDVGTKQQCTLKTRDPKEAQRLLAARNEASRDSFVSREVGLAYLAAAAPAAKERAWEWVIEQIVATKSGQTKARWEVASRDKAFRPILSLVLVDTRAEHFLAVLASTLSL